MGSDGSDKRLSLELRSDACKEIQYFLLMVIAFVGFLYELHFLVVIFVVFMTPKNHDDIPDKEERACDRNNVLKSASAPHDSYFEEFQWNRPIDLTSQSASFKPEKNHFDFQNGDDSENVLDKFQHCYQNPLYAVEDNDVPEIVTNEEVDIGYEDSNTKSNEFYPSKLLTQVENGTTKIEPALTIQLKPTFVELANSNKHDLMRDDPQNKYPRHQPEEPEALSTPLFDAEPELQRQKVFPERPKEIPEQQEREHAKLDTKSDALFPWTWTILKEVGTTQGTRVEPLNQEQSTFVELRNSSDKLDLMRDIQKKMKTYPRPRPAEPLTEPEALSSPLLDPELQRQKVFPEKPKEIPEQQKQQQSTFGELGNSDVNHKLADHQPGEQEKFDDIPVRTPKDQNQDIPGKDECAGQNIVLTPSVQNASSRLPIVTNEEVNIGYEDCSTKSNELYPLKLLIEVGRAQETQIEPEPLIRHQPTVADPPPQYFPVINKSNTITKLRIKYHDGKYPVMDYYVWEKLGRPRLQRAEPRDYMKTEKAIGSPGSFYKIIGKCQMTIKGETGCIPVLVVDKPHLETEELDIYFGTNGKLPSEKFEQESLYSLARKEPIDGSAPQYFNIYNNELRIKFHEGKYPVIDYYVWEKLGRPRLLPTMKTEKAVGSPGSIYKIKGKWQMKMKFKGKTGWVPILVVNNYLHYKKELVIHFGTDGKLPGEKFDKESLYSIATMGPIDCITYNIKTKMEKWDVEVNKRKDLKK